MTTRLLDVTVDTITARTTASALAVRNELCRLFGAEEVFLLEDLHAGDPGSPRGASGTGTVVGFRRLAEISVIGDEVTVRGDGPAADLLRARCGGTSTNVWDTLRKATGSFRVRTELPGFAFGFLTTVGYDAAALMEDLPPRQVEPGVPDLTLTLFQHTLWFDRAGTPPVLYVASGPDLPEPLPTAVLHDVSDIGPVPAATLPRAVRDTVGKDTFLGWIERCLDHIRVGDIYQIQVGHRIDVDSELTPEQVYRRLRHRNPSPYMYLVTQSGTTLVGASPELLFRVDDDARITMRPIAGTTRRDPAGVDDERRIKDLVASVKEQAEHVMLVDLCRNDVGRVCRPGTLSVDELMAVEAFSHVFHLVSTVTGAMADDRDVWDVLCATFPAGTVTGAPKVRAMEIIDELEGDRRGVYAGGVGLIDVRGRTELALCIRTITHHERSTGGHRYSTQSCAGVVALSEPEREWDETLAKMGAAYWALTGEELA